MSLIMGQIKVEHPELFALEFGIIAESDFGYTPASTNIDQSSTELGQNVYDHKISDEFNYGCNQTRTLRVVYQIEPEHSELFALEFGKIAESDFVYTLEPTNINQWAPNLVKMYVTIRSWMISIMDLIEPELS